MDNSKRVESDQLKSKLMEIISHTPNCGFSSSKAYEHLADHLIANGVRLESKQATSDENKRMQNNTDYIRVPRSGGKVNVKFDANAIIGTVTFGDESVPVYLSLMSAQRLHQISGSFIGNKEPPADSVKRTFTFIEK